MAGQLIEWPKKRPQPILTATLASSDVASPNPNSMGEVSA